MKVDEKVLKSLNIDKKVYLSEVEYKVLALKYGILDGESKTLKKTSEILDKPLSTIYTIEKRAIEKLRYNKEIWLEWNNDINLADIVLSNLFIKVEHEILNYSLTETEYKVLALRYGILDGESKTLEKTSEILNKASSTICLTEKRAKEKLRYNKEIWLEWNKDINLVDKILNYGLTETEYKVLALRYGILDGESKTLEKTSEIVDKPISTVYVIEKRAKKKLIYNKEAWLKWNNDISLVDKILNNLKHKMLNYGLTETEYKVLALRYGILDGKSKTLKKISEILGKPLATIYTIEKRAKEKLINNKEAWLKWNNDISLVDNILDVNLTEIEYKVLALKYGILDGESKTLEKTSEIVDKPISIVYEIIKRAKGKLRYNKKIWLEWNADINNVNLILGKVTKSEDKVIKDLEEDREISNERICFLNEKIELMKEKVKKNLYEVYKMVITENILIVIINSFSVQMNISYEEYYSITEKYLLIYLSRHKEFVQLDCIVNIFHNKIKMINPLFSYEQIATAIKIAFLNYSGEVSFEDEIIRKLRKS